MRKDSATRKDLVESGQVKSARDLKGRTVSTGAKGIAMDFFLAKMMEDVGLTYDALNVTYLSYPDGVKALASKAVDAREFLAAYLKGVRYYNDKGFKDPEVLTIVSVETVKASFPLYIAPDGRPRMEDLLALQDFFLARDWMKTKVPIDKMVDLSFLP